MRMLRTIRESLCYGLFAAALVPTLTVIVAAGICLAK